MATPRLDPYTKAYRRALRLQANLMVNQDVDQEDVDVVNEAWETVVNLHQPPEGCAPDCHWCLIYPGIG